MDHEEFVKMYFGAEVVECLDPDDIDTDVESPALLALECGRRVLENYGDEPEVVLETSDGWAIGGGEHLMLMSPELVVYSKDEIEDLEPFDADEDDADDDDDVGEGTVIDGNYRVINIGLSDAEVKQAAKVKKAVEKIKGVVGKVGEDADGRLLVIVDASNMRKVMASTRKLLQKMGLGESFDLDFDDLDEAGDSDDYVSTESTESIVTIPASAAVRFQKISDVLGIDEASVRVDAEGAIRVTLPTAIARQVCVKIDEAEVDEVLLPPAWRVVKNLKGLRDMFKDFKARTKLKGNRVEVRTTQPGPQDSVMVMLSNFISKTPAGLKLNTWNVSWLTNRIMSVQFDVPKDAKKFFDAVQYQKGSKKESVDATVDEAGTFRIEVPRSTGFSSPMAVHLAAAAKEHGGKLGKIEQGAGKFYMEIKAKNRKAMVASLRRVGFKITEDVDTSVVEKHGDYKMDMSGAKAMMKKGYEYMMIIPGDKRPMYTKTMKDASALMKKEYRDKKGIKVMKIADYMKDVKESIDEQQLDEMMGSSMGDLTVYLNSDGFYKPAVVGADIQWEVKRKLNYAISNAFLSVLADTATGKAFKDAVRTALRKSPAYKEINKMYGKAFSLTTEGIVEVGEALCEAVIQKPVKVSMIKTGVLFKNEKEVKKFLASMKDLQAGRHPQQEDDYLIGVERVGKSKQVNVSFAASRGARFVKGVIEEWLGYFEIEEAVVATEESVDTLSSYYDVEYLIRPVDEDTPISSDVWMAITTTLDHIFDDADDDLDFERLTALVRDDETIADVLERYEGEFRWVDDIDEDVEDAIVAEIKLTAKARKKLPDSAFVFPDERAYPIQDETHARNALTRGAQYETGKRLQAIRRAVAEKYPDMKVTGTKSAKMKELPRKKVRKKLAAHDDGAESNLTEVRFPIASHRQFREFVDTIGIDEETTDAQIDVENHIVTVSLHPEIAERLAEKIDGAVLVAA